MSPRSRAVPPEIPSDPFGERRAAAFRECMQLLGGRFHFETDSTRLLHIVRYAYAKLPPHKLSATAPHFRVKLLLASKGRLPQAARMAREPPRVRPFAGGGILCGAMESANFMALSPRQRSALVVISQDMLEFPYHIRYELLEFAVYALAARVQKLVPLHAACVGGNGQGILLLGASGAGKSTLALHCLLEGFEFLAEDSVLVKPDGLLATGIANFLHVRVDSLRFLRDTNSAAATRKSAVIRRRSGVEKFEINLRRSPYRLAPAPQRIGALVFISSKSAGNRPLLTPLRGAAIAELLASDQRYAASQPGWSSFARQASGLPAFELRRGHHPVQAVEALRALLPSDLITVGRRERR
jgi:hypothetical protein